MLGQLIKSARCLCNSQPKEIIYFYVANQSFYRISFVCHVPRRSNRRGGRHPKLQKTQVVELLLDDLMSKLANNSHMTNLNRKHSHNRNISVVFELQSLFWKRTRTISFSVKKFSQQHCCNQSHQTDVSRQHMLSHGSVQQCYEEPLLPPNGWWSTWSKTHETIVAWWVVIRARSI